MSRCCVLFALSAVLGLHVGGCKASPTASIAPPSGGEEPPASPETVFASLERRLSAGPTSIDFTVVASGAVEVELEGRLVVGEESELVARGSFAGQPQDLRLWTEGDLLHGGPVDAPSFARSRPLALDPALIIGFTRMGVLHNIAMLVGGAPPDHADGGVEDWVQTVEHHHVQRADASGIAFALRVDGQPSGEATVWLDDEGLPIEREQVVDFPEGQMRVRETYSFIESVPSGP